MRTILSTKKLTKTQKSSVLKAGFSVEEYDFIKIEPTDFEMPKEVNHAIFTSQNTVKRVMSPPAERAGYALRVKNCYCVGQKTKALLEQNGMKVIAFAEYGKDLANILVEKYPEKEYTFFCGNRRRNELPSILKANNVTFEEVMVYKTLLSPKHFEQKFDGVLFFSPSGVKSYCEENTLKNTTAFCIGTTTATAARKYTYDVEIAKEPTIESVINTTCASLSN